MHASSEPNFSGTWEANLQKSVVKGRQPSKLIVKIEHENSKILQQVFATYTAGEQEQIAFWFETIGTETTNAIGGVVARTKAHWEGTELVIETRVTGGARDFQFRDYWSLSADGSTLTMDHRDDDMAGQISVLGRVVSSA